MAGAARGLAQIFLRAALQSEAPPASPSPRPSPFTGVRTAGGSEDFTLVPAPFFLPSVVSLVLLILSQHLLSQGTQHHTPV